MKKQNNLEKTLNEENNLEKTLTKKQARAISYSQNFAKEILEKHPEIIKEYTKNSLIVREIAEKYFPDKIRGNGQTVCCAIHQALDYALGREQKRKIGEENVSLRNRETGKKLYNEFLEYQKSSKNPDDKEKKKFGLFSMTAEERRKASRKAIINSGNIPYDHVIKETEYGPLNEQEYIIKLKDCENPSWKEMVARVNFHFKHKRKLEMLRPKYKRVKDSMLKKDK